MFNKSSTKKEIEKKMLIKKTLNEMNKQVQKLEDQKQVYIRSGREAKEKGLTKQFELAKAGLRMTMLQQNKVLEMKLNFEITSQMKDMSAMTQSFLSGMSSLSKDMCKLTKEKDFLKVGKEFDTAMQSAEMQTELLDSFMDNTASSFSTNSTMSSEDDKELNKLFETGIPSGEITDSQIEKDLEDLMKKKMS